MDSVLSWFNSEHQDLPDISGFKSKLKILIQIWYIRWIGNQKSGYSKVMMMVDWFRIIRGKWEIREGLPASDHTCSRPTRDTTPWEKIETGKFLRLKLENERICVLKYGDKRIEKMENKKYITNWQDKPYRHFPEFQLDNQEIPGFTSVIRLLKHYVLDTLRSKIKGILVMYHKINPGNSLFPISRFHNSEG